MTVKKALIIEGVYLHAVDAPELDDIQVYVSNDTVDITTHHKNTISLDFEELDAINALVAEARKPTSRAVPINLVGVQSVLAMAAGAMRFSGLAATVRESEQRAVEGARNPTPTWSPEWSKINEKAKFIAKDSNGKTYGYQRCPRMSMNQWLGGWVICSLPDDFIPGNWQTSLHERPTDEVPAPAPTWPPDWSEVPVGFDHAAVDSDGRGWVYAKEPERIQAVWTAGWLEAVKDLGAVTMPSGMTWKESYCKRPLVKPVDDLAFLRLSWVDVPEQYNFVAADKNGQVWAYMLPPRCSEESIWVSRNEANKNIAQREPNTFGDWEESLRIRPTAMKQILGIDWENVPEQYNFVAADVDGTVYGYPSRPSVTSTAVWSPTYPFGKLAHITLPPNLSWRNTLFVRPGYTEPQS